jgi:hypothetical protein
MARAGASSGRQTNLLALEAEVGEIAARLYFEELGKLVRNKRLDFGGWWRGDWTELDEKYGPDIEEILEPFLSNLHTMYKKRGDFTTDSLSEVLEAIESKTEMVILDHVHVIDSTDEGELRAQSKTVRLLRDMALDAQIPVVAVSHIRKRGVGNGSIIPQLDDLHGSSNLSKVATQVVMLARDWDGPRDGPHLSPTFIQVLKDRRGRHSNLVARICYDMSEGRYEKAYQLGRFQYVNRQQTWVELEKEQVPHWAKNEARNLINEVPV